MSNEELKIKNEKGNTENRGMSKRDSCIFLQLEACSVQRFFLVNSSTNQLVNYQRL
jgi:hypothetical protein